MIIDGMGKVLSVINLLASVSSGTVALFNGSVFNAEVLGSVPSCTLIVFHGTMRHEIHTFPLYFARVLTVG